MTSHVQPNGRSDPVLTLVAVQQLVDMGFPLSEAERHLAEANGNLEVVGLQIPLKGLIWENIGQSPGLSSWR